MRCLYSCRNSKGVFTSIPLITQERTECLSSRAWTKHLSQLGGSPSWAAVAVLLTFLLGSFAEAKTNIIRFGGRVVDNLDEPKLTHIVVDKRDKTRRLALMNRTKQ